MAHLPMDPRAVFDRGLDDPSSLSEVELFVYLVMELETYNDMEGWYHFFTTDKMRFYDVLRVGLTAAQDHASSRVLADFESYLSGHHVPLESSAIEDFFCSASDDQLQGAQDWGEAFRELTERRWLCISEYLRSLHITLVA